MRRSSIIALIGLAALIPTTTRSDDAPTLDEASWTALPDNSTLDSSRNLLFKEFVVAAALKDAVKDLGPDAVDLGLPDHFIFPRDAEKDRTQRPPVDRPPSQFIIDISHYTGKDIDFSIFRAQKIAGVYAKATQGTAYKDNFFSTYWNQLSQLDEGDKVSKGAYHFLSSSGDPVIQANRFIDYVNLHGGFAAGDLPPCMDLEWDRTSTVRDQWKGQSAPQIITKAKRWLEVVKSRTGRTPVIYTARSFLSEHGMETLFKSELGSYPLWIADYSRTRRAVEKPSIPGGMTQLLWQYASDAQLESGYDGGLDASIFYGTSEEFKTAFAK